MRRGAGVDGAVGADDRLNAGHPVYCSEERKIQFKRGRTMMMLMLIRRK